GGGGGGDTTPVPTGSACTASGPRCADAAATCTTYASAGAPSGTYCLLPDGGPCAENDDCAAAHCTAGSCTSCTVCASGCPHDNIQDAYNASSAGDVILIAPGDYNGGVTNVKQEITFRRCGSEGVVAWNNTVDSYSIAGFINSASPAAYTITVEDIEFTATGGGSVTGGIAIYADPSSPRISFTGRNLVVHDMKFAGTSSRYCAMEFSTGVIVTLTDCEFRDNSCNKEGGAIHIDDDRGNVNDVTITGCTFTGNSTGGSNDGGAIDIVLGTGGTATISDCTFTGNTASNGGGAITTNSPTTITGCTFSGNDAVDGSAIIYRDGSAGAISGCTFTDNTSDTYGCILIGEGNAVPTTVNITDCTITGNTGYSGAGIAYFTAGGTISGCTISGNTAGDRGGGVFIAGGNVTISGCTISGNTANEFETDNNGSIESGGGGLMIGSGAFVGLLNTNVTGNQSKNYGGGAFVYAGTASTTLQISGTSTVSGNSIKSQAIAAGSGIARRYFSLSSYTATITGAATAVTGNTTPPTQCASAVNNVTTFTNVSGCAFT
ncbi:MAG: hypothetical protein ACKOWF_10095, partial [Chloroflexota bacterium]